MGDARRRERLGVAFGGLGLLEADVYSPLARVAGSCYMSEAALGQKNVGECIVSVRPGLVRRTRGAPRQSGACVALPYARSGIDAGGTAARELVWRCSLPTPDIYFQS